VPEAACTRIARVFSEMWGLAVVTSTMGPLTAIGGGPGGVGATLIPLPGVLADIGANLPDPRTVLAMAGIPGHSVQAALREDLLASVDRAVGAPRAPSLEEVADWQEKNRYRKPPMRRWPRT